MKSEAALPKPKAPGQRSKSKNRGTPRPARRSEEDQPLVNYVERMEKLGPRQGESYLAFRKRLAAIIEARSLWLQVWRRFSGHKENCANWLGIPRGNVAYELRKVGLSAELLKKAIDGKVKL